MKESVVQKSILDWLAWNKFVFWRSQAIPVPIRRGRSIVGLRRADPHSIGIPDIMVILSPHGQLLGIECKSDKGKQSPEQLEWQNRIESVGGVYIVARDLDDIIKYNLTIKK